MCLATISVFWGAINEGVCCRLSWMIQTDLMEAASEQSKTNSEANMAEYTEVAKTLYE